MTLYELTKSKVKDETGKLTDPADYDAAISEALNSYSGNRPRLVVADIPGSGVTDYATPTGWVEGLSVVESIEYPAGQNPEIILDDDDWRLYRSPAGLKIRLIEATPQAGETIRILYTAGHTEASILIMDFEAVGNLAASICLRMLAAAYGQSSDSTIMADSVNYRSKGDEFARRAKELEGLYRAHIGVKENDTTVAACVTASPQRSRRGSLTHRRG